MPVLTDASGRTVVTTSGHSREIVHRRRGLARLEQFIDYAFWLLYALLFLRLLAVTFRANPGVGFVRFLDSVTNPFYGPFRGIAPSPDGNGQFTIAVPVIVAMAVYGLLHLAIRKLLRVLAYRRTEV